MQKTILVDMDEVLVNFIESWLAAYNRKYQDQLTKQHITDWEISRFTKQECGNKIYELLREPGLFRSPTPTPHSQEVISRLIDKGYEIVIVSDAPAGHAFCDYQKDAACIGNPADDKRKWLQEHFPMIPSSNLIFTSQKWRVMGDLLIDDKPDTFHAFRSRNRPVLLMDQPHNRHIETQWRISNMLEAEQHIDRLFTQHPAVTR